MSWLLSPQSIIYGATMVKRRFLTPEFLRNLDAPKTAEYWVADTKLRGFGVRVWSSNEAIRFSYAVRKTDQNGKSVRRSLSLDSLRRMHYHPADYAFGGDPGAFFAKDLADFLPEARCWARLEIAKITGKIESDAILKQAQKADTENREKTGAYVSNLTLRYCVELVLKYRMARGWTEDYEDRLRRAFDAFDTVTGAGQRTINELDDGVLAGMIEGAPIGFGTMRLLRSLLRVTTENIEALNGPRSWRLLPRNLEPYASPKEEALEFLKNLTFEDYERFLSGIRSIDASWQSKISIELAFHFFAPFSRIRTGRWSHIVEGRWYPYGNTRRSSGYLVFENIEGPASECLTLAKETLAELKNESDYWFPAVGKTDEPIKNVDRTWKKIRQNHNWPDVSLGLASKYFNRRYYWRNMPLWFGTPNNANDGKFVQMWDTPLP